MQYNGFDEVSYIISMPDYLEAVRSDIITYTALYAESLAININLKDPESVDNILFVEDMLEKILGTVIFNATSMENINITVKRSSREGSMVMFGLIDKILLDKEEFYIRNLNITQHITGVGYTEIMIKIMATRNDLIIHTYKKRGEAYATR